MSTVPRRWIWSRGTGSLLQISIHTLLSTNTTFSHLTKNILDTFCDLSSLHCSRLQCDTDTSSTISGIKLKPGARPLSPLTNGGLRHGSSPWFRKECKLVLCPVPYPVPNPVCDHLRFAERLEHD